MPLNKPEHLAPLVMEIYEKLYDKARSKMGAPADAKLGSCPYTINDDADVASFHSLDNIEATAGLTHVEQLTANDLMRSVSGVLIKEFDKLAKGGAWNEQEVLIRILKLNKILLLERLMRQFVG